MTVYLLPIWRMSFSISSHVICKQWSLLVFLFVHLQISSFFKNNFVGYRNLVDPYLFLALWMPSHCFLVPVISEKSAVDIFFLACGKLISLAAPNIFSVLGLWHYCCDGSVCRPVYIYSTWRSLSYLNVFHFTCEDFNDSLTIFSSFPLSFPSGRGNFLCNFLHSFFSLLFESHNLCWSVFNYANSFFCQFTSLEP